MKRGATIAGWTALALEVGAFLLLYWIAELAEGPPYNVCGVSMHGAQFGVVGLAMIVAGFLIGLIAANGLWRAGGWMLVPPILAIGLAIPAVPVYLVTLMFTFGWEC